MKALPLAALALLAVVPAVRAADVPVDLSEPLPPKAVTWSFEGPFGTYDRAAWQRGFQVYKEVCSACHSLSRVAFHDLTFGFSEAQAKALAAAAKVPADPNDKGETTDDKGERLMRPGILADHFQPPFANEEAARANNGGALPPDLSLIVKAREGGGAYVYSILTGFHLTPPKGFVVQTGKYFNPYFAGGNISMPPPLAEGSVTYADGTTASIDQEAHDVVTFLSWAAEPKMEERKHIGLGAMAFMLLISGLLFLSYRRVWKDAH